MPFTKLKGRDLMLCDVIYQRASKQTQWSDYINIIYRDLKTMKKEKMVIKDPTIELYTVKPEYRTFKKPRQFIETDKTTAKTVKYRDVYFEIAKERIGE